jgi:hypothetical protein
MEAYLEQPIEQRILDEHGYIIGAFTSPLSIGQVLETMPCCENHRSPRVIQGPLVVLAETDRREAIRQERKYNGRNNFSRHFTHFYRLVAE